MRIFLTGASGYVGSAVLDAFARAGHQVTGLVRHSENAAKVAARGGTPLCGDLLEPSSYRPAAEGHDVFIHAGFDGTRGAEADRVAIDTLIDAARAGDAMASQPDAGGDARWPCLGGGHRGHHRDTPVGARLGSGLRGAGASGVARGASTGGTETGAAL